MLGLKTMKPVVEDVVRQALELAQDERMVLIGADRDVFLAALLEPPAPSEKLVAALRRHRAART